MYTFWHAVGQNTGPGVISGQIGQWALSYTSLKNKLDKISGYLLKKEYLFLELFKQDTNFPKTVPTPYYPEDLIFLEIIVYFLLGPSWKEFFWGPIYERILWGPIRN